MSFLRERTTRCSHDQAHHHCDIIHLATTGPKQTAQERGLLQDAETAEAGCEFEVSWSDSSS
jgi:hypothetical protein